MEKKLDTLQKKVLVRLRPGLCTLLGRTTERTAPQVPHSPLFVHRSSSEDNAQENVLYTRPQRQSRVSDEGFKHAFRF